MALAPSITINLPGWPFENFPSVATIAALRDLPSIGFTTGDNYVADGGAAAGDGGGGVFAWNDASIASDDGVTVIRPSDTSPGQAGRWVLTTKSILQDRPTNATLSADSGSSLIGYKAPYVAAQPRTAGEKLNDSISVMDFGAVGDGVTDDTAAIQAAVNSGCPSVFVPPRNFVLEGDVTLPNLAGFDFYGCGRGTNFLVRGGAGFKYAPSGTVRFLIQQIRDMQFTDQGGTDHTLNLAYAGNINLRRLFFSNSPVGKASIYVAGAGANYTHDVRINDVEILTSTAGDAGILLGATSTDNEIKNYTFNGTFNVNYAIKAEVGAGSTYLADSHIYNAKLNVLFAMGMSDALICDNVGFDNAIEDLVFMTNSIGTLFNSCRFQAIRAGKSGLTNSGGAAALLTSSRFDGAAGAQSCVRDILGAIDTRVIGAYVATPGNFTEPFDLGVGGVTRFTNTDSYQGYQLGYSHVAQTSVAGGLTRYLGVNGAQTNADVTNYVAPISGKLSKAVIRSSVPPGSGQSYTFTVLKNGSSVGSGSISDSNTVATISLSASVTEGDRLVIKVDTSATAAAAIFEYFINGDG